MASSFFSTSSNVSPNISSIFCLMLPEPFLSTCVKASYSPCISERKCSVPFGRLSIASRLIISVEVSAMFLKFLDNNSKYFNSDIFHLTYDLFSIYKNFYLFKVKLKISVILIHLFHIRTVLLFK